MNTLPGRRPVLPSLKFVALCFLAGGIFLSGGCGKKSKPPVPVDQSSDPAAAPALANSTPTPGNPPPVVPVAVSENVDASAQLAQLTQVLRRYGAERRRVPQSLGEVAAAGYLAGLPAAPAGKQFVIDAKRMQVVLENK